MNWVSKGMVVVFFAPMVNCIKVITHWPKVPATNTWLTRMTRTIIYRSICPGVTTWPMCKRSARCTLHDGGLLLFVVVCCLFVAFSPRFLFGSLDKKHSLSILGRSYRLVLFSPSVPGTNTTFVLAHREHPAPERAWGHRKRATLVFTVRCPVNLRNVCNAAWATRVAI